MKNYRATLAMVLSVILCVCLFALPVMADGVSHSGLEVTLTADKAEYAGDENITATLTVKNTGRDAFQSLTLEHLTPKGLDVAEGDAKKVVESLAAGESISVAVTYTAGNPASGDATTWVIALMVAAGAGLATLMIVDKKSRKVSISMMLCCVMLLSVVPAQAAGLNEAITVSTKVKVNGSDVTLKAQVSQKDNVYNGLTQKELDAMIPVNSEDFDHHMNVTWNFGWEGNATLEHNATKIDFAKDADPAAKKWETGIVGNGIVDNAGWGAQLWTHGEGSSAFIYNKVDIPEYTTQFRIWAAGLTNEHWSGNGAIRAVAIYEEDGKQVKKVLEPVADSFIGNKTTVWNEEDGTVRFYNAQGWSIPDVLDGCMIIYKVDGLQGKKNVTIVVESIGMGDKLGTAETEAVNGVPAGQVMPECVIVKRVMFIVEKPAAPADPVVYHGMKASDLDALPGIKADEFSHYMNVGWNFGWDSNPVADKVDFAGTADASSKLWKLGKDGAEGEVLHDNAGWGVMLWSRGAGNVSYMYSKLDVPENVNEFRVWAGGNIDGFSGSGAIRVVAWYKDENGNYVKQVMVPREGVIVSPETVFNSETGAIHFANAQGWSIPGLNNGDGMIIYDMGNLRGKTDVVIFVESIGLGTVTNADGATMPECVIVKRVMFL